VLFSGEGYSANREDAGLNRLEEATASDVQGVVQRSSEAWDRRKSPGLQLLDTATACNIAVIAVEQRGNGTRICHRKWLVMAPLTRPFEHSCRLANVQVESRAE